MLPGLTIIILLQLPIQTSNASCPCPFGQDLHLHPCKSCTRENQFVANRANRRCRRRLRENAREKFKDDLRICSGSTVKLEILK